MIGSVVLVVLPNQAIVARELVRVDPAALGHLLADHSSDCRPRDFGHWRGVDLATPLQEPEDSLLPVALRPRFFLRSLRVGGLGFDVAT